MPQPTATAPPTATPTGVPVGSIFGVELDGQKSDWPAVNALSAGRDLGAAFVRRNHIDWGVVESSRGRYDFTATDEEILSVASLNARPIVIVMGTPAWARPNASYSVSGPFPADYLADYASFWKAVVARYSKAPYNVKYWEVYNEPDNTSREVEGVVGVFGGAPADYARILQTAYQAAKSADPGATVLFGSLAFDFFNDSADLGIGRWDLGGIFNRSFLDQVVAAGGGPYFDGLGFHYYPEYDGRWVAKKQGMNALAAKAEVLRDTLKKYGLDKPLYNTELGYPSGAVPGVNSTEEAQARFLVRTFVRAAAARLRSVIWYKLADFKADQATKDFFSYHGLVGSDGRTKISHGTFRVVVQTLSGASYVRQLTSVELGAATMEGYLFRTSQGKDLRALWSNSDAAQVVNVPNASSLAVTRKDGSSQTVAGSSVTVTGDPLFVLSN